MPTKEEKEAELRRVTKLSGFRFGWHEFLAEVDFDNLKKRNDRWEAEERNQTRLQRMIIELTYIAAYTALRNPPEHIQIHVHAAHQAGASAKEIYEVIDRTGMQAGGAARQNGME